MFIPRCSPIFIPSPIVYIPMFIWIHLLPGNHSLWEMMSIPSNKNSWSPWIARSRGSYGAAVELGASWPCQWRAAPMEKWINRRTYRQTDRKAHSQRGRQTNRSDICVCVSGWKTQDPENKTMVEHSWTWQGHSTFQAADAHCWIVSPASGQPPIRMNLKHPSTLAVWTSTFLMLAESNLNWHVIWSCTSPADTLPCPPCVRTVSLLRKVLSSTYSLTSHQKSECWKSIRPACVSC